MDNSLIRRVTVGRTDGDDADYAERVWVCECEIGGAARVASVLPPSGATKARAVVRLHGQPLGYVELPLVDVESLAAGFQRAAVARFREAILEHLRSEGLGLTNEGLPPPAATTCPESDPGPKESVSVVVCTRNRADSVEACLSSILRNTSPGLELVVVDNAPTDDSTLQVVQAIAERDARVRYAREDQPGLSRARNRGLAEARGRYIAYTDDDVIVDDRWVTGLLRAFVEARVGCVTGLVATAGISSAAEAYFDARAASWSSRFAPEVYDLAERSAPDALYPYSAGIFGTGANFCFDRQLLLDLGGFDVALGAGAPTRGGEDLDIFVRVLRAGRAIAYEPRALVWHHHRADDAALLRQMYGYGTGLSAYLCKLLLDPSTRLDVLRRVPRGLWRLTRIRKQTSERLTSPAAASRRALGWELAGLLAGPALYVRAQRHARVVGSARGSS